MELTVSTAAASMLVAGIGSTIYVASRAVGDGDGERAPVVAGSMTIEQLASDLQYAVNFTERSATAVEFTVADRNGDAASETIRYEWSGAPGEPVTRTFNGGDPQTVAGNVHDFDLDYRVQTVTQITESAGGSTESAEMLLASFTGWSGVTPTEAYRPLTSTSWVTEYFEPTWPVDADQLNITRVRVMLAKSADPGDLSVGIHAASGGTGPAPETTPIGTVQTVSGAGLTSTYEWQEITFSDVALTNASSGYNIVLKGVGSGARVRYYLGATAPADSTVYLYTSSSGSSWAPSASVQARYDVPFYVYGTYTSSTPTETTTERYFIRSIGIGLQVGSDADGRIESGSEVLNAPEVAGP
ncbi:MAG: hypothetical protein RIC55_10730 [Pirellulaceae bacterium]